MGTAAQQQDDTGSYEVPGYPTPNESAQNANLPNVFNSQEPYFETPFHGDLNQRRYVELRLLHHFTSTVMFTFPSSEEKPIQEMWSGDVVRLAFDFDLLLNAIFSFSAWHLVRNVPLSRRLAHNESQTSAIFKTLLNTSNPPSIGYDPVKAHRFYLDLAVQQQREAAANLSAENSNAIYLASILLGFQTLGQLDIDELDTGSYCPPTQWLRMMIAIRDIMNASLQFFDRSQHIAVFMSDITKPNFNDEAAMYNPEYAFPFAEYLDWEKHPEPDLDDDTKYFYKRSLYYVGGVYQAIRNQEEFRGLFHRIFGFPPMVPKGFIDLIDQRRPRALAILALHCALIKVVDDHWIFNGVAEREVRGIQSIMPMEWQWAMQPPLNLLENLSPVF